MNLKLRFAVEVLMDFLAERTSLEQMPYADIIFVFGHHDKRVAQQAAYLYHQDKASRIIVTGKGEEKIPQGYETEADYLASFIVGRGVWAGSILFERESMNSLENVQLGKKVWQGAGLDPKIVIACAIPPLLRRSCATLRKQCPGVAVYGSAFKLLSEEWMVWRRMMRLVGEIDRLEEYAKKGDIEAVKIPPDVRSAAQTVRLYCVA